MGKKKLEWHTEKRKINDLIPYEGNPRQMNQKQKEDLEESLKRFNLMSIPVVNTDNIIVSGHQRLKILQLLDRGEETIDVRIPNRKLTSKELREANLRENKNLGSWDYDLLANIDKEVLLDVGFTEEELDDKFNLAEGKGDEDNFDVDKALEEIKKPICKREDIWQLGEHRLMCGDATVEKNVDKLIDGNKADMVFTDPPYNSLTTWGKQRGKKESRLNPEQWFDNDGLSMKEYLKLLIKSFGILRLILHNNSPFYVCTDFRVYDLNKRALEECGASVKHCIVWNKNQWGLGWKYRFKHEFLIYGSFSKDCNFYGGRDQPDVWDIDVDRKGLHSTQKPVELVARAIRHSTKENELTVDLFGGSGTTLIACEQLNRKCYMMEIAPIYCDVIIKRWEKFTSRQAVKIN